MPMSSGPALTRAALVLIPAGLNYFYEQHGRRLAEALEALGFEVDVRTLATVPQRTYDWCVLTNITEILLSHGQTAEGEVTGQITPQQEKAALNAMTRLHDHCGQVVCCSLDCVGTSWYEWIQRRCAAVGIGPILDFGLQDQRTFLDALARCSYRFLVNGLTPSERRAVEQAPEQDRPIPWAYVGHATPNRVALVDHLVQEVDPRGFVYLPQLGKVTARGSPHLNQAQYDLVLKRSRYQVWCSHHTHFYMESERFRMSLLAGCVPIKVTPPEQPIPPGLPFDYLIVPEDQLTRRLRSFEARSLFQRFRDDFCNLPSLSSVLASYLAGRGILPSSEVECPLGPIPFQDAA
jgi:hypothetical protein